LLEVTTAQPLKKPAKLKVRINDSNGQPRKGLLLAAPEQLVPTTH